MDFFNEKKNYYRELIMNHYYNPKNKGFKNLLNSIKYKQKNESCIDNFKFEIFIETKIIKSARFIGIGCIISTAANDIFCLMIEGKKISKIKKIINNFQNMLLKKKFNEKIIENMIAFKNVPKQINRIKCATIGINSIKKIIEKK